MVSPMARALFSVGVPVGLSRCMTSGLEKKFTRGDPHEKLMIVRYLAGRYPLRDLVRRGGQKLCRDVYTMRGINNNIAAPQSDS